MFLRCSELLKSKQRVLHVVPSIVNRSYFRKYVQSFLGLDRLDRIEKNMVNRDDLRELSTSFNFRRELLLPVSRFKPLVAEPSVHVKEVTEMKAEFIHFSRAVPTRRL